MMAAPSERFVPKVHPATRPVEPEDPLSLHATAVAGDPDVMLQCLVQEYAWLGWDAEHILSLFHDPFYPALHQMLLQLGENNIRRRLNEILATHGILHFEEIVQEDPEPDHAEPDLIQLGIPWQQHGHDNDAASVEGGSHAAGL